MANLITRPDHTLGPFANAGAPGAGTDEVQTITIGGTPTGGTFKLSFKGQVTAAISWSATNATLVSNIDAALGALATVGGAANVTTAVGTMTAGIGTITVTFAAALGKRAVPTIAVANNSMTGTSPTIAVAETTPGVDATLVGAAKGALLVDTTNAKLYINTGTTSAPTWTVAGSQS
jgi:hypothetical protein